MGSIIFTYRGTAYHRQLVSTRANIWLDIRQIFASAHIYCINIDVEMSKKSAV